ncbi:hypothetical protein [Yoonia sediminilitoris]|uniref:Uncharacterized protein n=1 Tax=Yoonia sediminilitoris TaxID=1286148 RepID=A0A2T6KQR7_9RHOB|nr:hypothetical protein [Yoonia sediminilitoris]PUB18890.1 hypothetical protein C8N45_101481 [Yoonia sediminilitoris]RCW99058.1 hypothetical protein DFP92_101481 [Yoonia sediminilitoris]
MTPPAKAPLFLERVRYRQRRVRDAAKLTPILGMVLLALPLLWSGDETVPESQTLIYVFGVWVGLVVIAATLSHFLREDDDESTLGEKTD